MSAVSIIKARYGWLKVANQMQVHDTYCGHLTSAMDTKTTVMDSTNSSHHSAQDGKGIQVQFPLTCPHQHLSAQHRFWRPFM